ncbi:DUF882 domain-containing protein [Phenylobacterium sp.]|uniref:DUF882 domain-containing protein n=1 Tax=Phenylobacterium sp. TaxID=1871053 RepID=UPI002ED7CA0D
MDPQRRAFILGGGALIGSAALGAAAKLPPRAPTVAPPVTPPPALAAPAVQTRPAADVRRLFLHNLHTGDTVKTVYWENGRYLNDALAEARFALRDWRNGQQHAMDPGLFDIFHELGARLETDRPFQIISGYRSPATNAALHARSSGVASKSLHLQGMATDIRVEGVQLAHVRNAALDLGRGGVGYYPVSNFVHVDTGRVRRWGGA